MIYSTFKKKTVIIKQIDSSFTIERGGFKFDRDCKLFILARCQLLRTLTLCKYLINTILLLV